MLDKFVAALALALFAYLEKRVARGSIAVDADSDIKALRVAAVRLRGWMREQNDLRSRVKSDADSGTKRGEDAGVPPH